MWGTIARMQVRPEVPDEYFKGQFRALNADRMKGWQYTSLFKSDTNPHEWWMVAIFDTKENYQANAGTTAQHGMYMMMRACLDADPEWHDVGEIISFGDLHGEALHH